MFFFSFWSILWWRWKEGKLMKNFFLVWLWSTISHGLIIFLFLYIHSFKITQFLPQEGRNLNKPMFSNWNACGLPGVGGGAGGNDEAWIDLLIIWRLLWFSYITCFHLEYCYSPWTGLMLIHYRLPLSEAFFSGLFDSLLVSIYTPVKRQRPFHVREKYIAQKHNGIMTLLVFKPGNFLSL